MKFQKRKFLVISASIALTVAATLLPMFGQWHGNAYGFYQSPAIPLFGTILRGVGPGQIPVAAPDATRAPVTGVTHYTIDINQFQDQVVPASTGLGPTTFWGYNPANPLGGGIQPQKHLGGIIIGQKGVPIQITFRNNLPLPHILPVDTTIPMADLAQNRAATHLHGGLVPWISDGGPFDWFAPNGNHGESFLNNAVLRAPNTVANNEAEYYYPLNQSARFMWYHDHAMGITRLNAYAGIASALLVRDKFEESLTFLGLPKFIENGGNEIPLVVQDKIFVGRDINAVDPIWKNEVAAASTAPGSLWYAHTYENRWTSIPSINGLALPEPSAIPEFFGDTMLVNGTTYPEVQVEARRYRLRLLNACNARWLNLQFYVENSKDGITLGSDGNPTNPPFINAATGDSSFMQIGTEGGFLAFPVKVPSGTPFALNQVVPDSGQVNPSLVSKSLLVAPAERPDIIVDFSNHVNQNIIVYNDAPAPFPSGDAVNDYFPGLNNGNPVNAATQSGFGPNSRVLMRFKVVPATSRDPRLVINAFTPLFLGVDPFLVPPGITTVPKLIPRRFLSLNEWFDDRGRLIQILGNAAAPNGSPYDGMATYQNYGFPPAVFPQQTVSATEEDVKAGSTEVWEVYNTTGDTHPMHFHLVNVQVVNRQMIDIDHNPFTPIGPIMPPAPNEKGWKETVHMYPGTVTRVIMKFDLSGTKIKTASGRLIATPPSPRTGGAEYVWHCHILEHEEHDMMHTLVVK